MKTKAHDAEETTLQDEAACWVVRRERGLSQTEQADFAAWLAVDESHAHALEEQSGTWGELDRLAGLTTVTSSPPNPDLLAKKKPLHFPRKKSAGWSLALGVAALFVLGIFLSSRSGAPWSGASPTSEQPQGPSICQELTLEDGTEVQLNRGSRLVTHFTPGERRVSLLGGEAYFKVAKNTARPFVVESRGVRAVAVGTAFNVCIREGSLEVLVSEGLVRVEQSSRNGAAVVPVPLLSPGQAVTIPLPMGRGQASIRTVNTQEGEALLGWRPCMMDFNAETLGAIVGELNRKNNMRIRIPDTDLAGLRLSASIRSDNVAGFLRLLDSGFGIETQGEGPDLVLRRK